MKAHVPTDNERIFKCKNRIIAAINEAQIPLAVTSLILENVQMQVQTQMQANAQKGDDMSAEQDVQAPKQ